MSSPTRSRIGDIIARSNKKFDSDDINFLFDYIDNLADAPAGTSYTMLGDIIVRYDKTGIYFSNGQWLKFNADDGHMIHMTPNLLSNIYSGYIPPVIKDKFSRLLSDKNGLSNSFPYFKDLNINPDGIADMYFDTNTKFHRDDGLPAVVFKDMYGDDINIYMKNGEYFRENDLPTIESPTYKAWVIDHNGTLSRANGHSFILTTKDGQLLREIHSVLGKAHRIDGPAVINVNSYTWSIFGTNLLFGDFLRYRRLGIGGPFTYEDETALVLKYG